MKPKIFIVASCYYDNDEVVACAIAEDGKVLASHFAKNTHWARYFMGLSGFSNYHKNDYFRHYPDGYELVDLIDLSDSEIQAHVDFMAALDRLHGSFTNQTGDRFYATSHAKGR